MWILKTEIIFMIEINNMCTSFSFIKHLNYYIVCRGDKINGIISAFTMFTIYYGDSRIYQYDIKIASGEYFKDLLKKTKISQKHSLGRNNKSKCHWKDCTQAVLKDVWNFEPQNWMSRGRKVRESNKQRQSKPLVWPIWKLAGSPLCSLRIKEEIIDYGHVTGLYVVCMCTCL